ncbi:chemotaxis protein CheA [Polyangium sp. 15x6]|uniref:chemotaxis protein CheA n=1 Tax=Polyangium sp. 15x6 TaxID=3042687 RepID=UPI00249CCC57|nr:chemotaxis protein CheA [Polyangium sp. 15x6]MDI3289353.1 chemotaxis protein CheA [Polyangium sp. 15x6]
MDAELEALVERFLGQSKESLDAIEDDLLGREVSTDDGAVLDRVFRAVHSLKGDAGTLGFVHVAELAHAMETALERMRARSFSPKDEPITLLLESVDVLRKMVEAPTSRSEALAVQSLSVRARLGRAVEGAAPPPPGGEEGLSTGPSSSSGVVGPARGAESGPRTLRIDLDKLDTMLTLLGEIAVARNRLTELLDGETPATGYELREAHEQADRPYRELQGLIMRARMVRLDEVFRRYARIARDLARASGKLVNLVVEAEGAEVDTRIVDHIRDALIHLVSNAVDHGIEHPRVRVAKGKDACGRIVMRARHDMGAVVVQIVDDGAGLDRTKILERAIASGHVTQRPELSDEEMVRLVLTPGFSTARAVTQTSGRGVGMDVVRRDVEAVRGTLRIESRAGDGCTVTLRIPLTVAIIDGFGVALEGTTYVLPIEAVSECLDFPAAERSKSDAVGLLDVRGTVLPYLRLRSLFEVSGAAPAREHVVVVQHEETTLGLVVDAVLGERQAVIKPLGPFLGHVPCVSGSTILGDGRVALVLSIPDICRHALALGERAQPGG